MMFDVLNLFPTGTHIASCEYCGRLIGFHEEDILKFTNDKTDFEILGIYCPQCENFLLLPDFEDNFGQDKEKELK